jgi:hypothetical protein
MQADRRKPNFLIQSSLMFYSRPVFRLNDLLCTHLTRILIPKQKLKSPTVAEALRKLDAQKRAIQMDLKAVGDSHGHVCASCGRCCKGTHERDSFSDRIMIDPATSFLKARRRESDGDAPAIDAARALTQLPMAEGGTVAGACHQLTCTGCRIPHELRPLQCAAYFCWAATAALSNDECRQASRALRRMFRLQWASVFLAMRSRLGYGRRASG